MLCYAILFYTYLNILRNTATPEYPVNAETFPLDCRLFDHFKVDFPFRSKFAKEFIIGEIRCEDTIHTFSLY